MRRRITVYAKLSGPFRKYAPFGRRCNPLVEQCLRPLIPIVQELGCDCSKLAQPLSATACSVDNRRAGPPLALTWPMTGTPARVLIVDDDEVVTETFARILRLEGHQVRTALSAEGGLREADASPPDAIILDLRMPLINGLGFLYRLRAREQHRATPVAIVTGDYCLDDTLSSELDQLGAEVHFKPIWLDELVDLAHALLAPNRRPTRRQPSLPN